MAVSLRCPECQATLGKDVENGVDAHCDECGSTFFNRRGQVLSKEHFEELKRRYPDKSFREVSKMYQE